MPEGGGAVEGSRETVEALPEDPDEAVPAGLLRIVADPDAPARLLVEGELDISSAPVLASALEEALADGRREVTFDLAGLAFVDSSGLAAIISAHKRLEALGGRLTLSGLPRGARKVIETTGLARYLDVEADPAAN